MEDSTPKNAKPSPAAPSESGVKASVLDHFKGVLFYIYPHRLISRVIYSLTRIRSPLVRVFIRAYARFFRVDLSDAASPDINDYACFNDFFTRALDASARPICSAADAVASPCDATITAFGRIAENASFEIKGQTYTVDRLFADSPERRFAPRFNNGHFCVLYLSPADYHRVHMPVDGALRAMVHVPGRLFSVADYAWKVIPRLLTRNERVISLFDSERDAVAVAMVGALNVGCIDVAWHGTVTPTHAAHQTFEYAQSAPRDISLKKGDELGRFNMGSTVVVLLENENFEWDAAVQEGAPIKMGAALGCFTS